VVEEQEPADNPFYSSYKEAVENKVELEDPLREARERGGRRAAEDQAALKKMEKEETVSEERSMSPPPPKRSKTDEEEEGEERGEKSKGGGERSKEDMEMGKFSGVGALKGMLEGEREKVEKELTEEEQRVRRKEAKVRRRKDPDNPTREEVEAQQELENVTWQDRYLRDKKVAAVVTSSKMISKVREKQKAEKKQAAAAGPSTQARVPGDRSQVPKVQALPGMIGSITEYATLVGTTVGKLAESRYVPPELSDSEEEQEEEGDDLWGAIMGPPGAK